MKNSTMLTDLGTMRSPLKSPPANFRVVRNNAVTLARKGKWSIDISSVRDKAIVEVVNGNSRVRVSSVDNAIKYINRRA